MLGRPRQLIQKRFWILCDIATAFSVRADAALKQRAGFTKRIDSGDLAGCSSRLAGGCPAFAGGEIIGEALANGWRSRRVACFAWRKCSGIWTPKFATAVYAPQQVFSIGNAHSDDIEIARHI